MSTANVALKNTLPIVTLSHKPTLILADKIVDQIALLHEKVRANTEWSGILLFKNQEGDFEKFVNGEPWSIICDEVIPMDIGTASYTEYDITPEDTFSFEKATDYRLAGGKQGHIHTHHSMNCFFSGTDTNELIDNAPNHNYYVSLIVNYKGHKEWCAKVAFVATIKEEGEIQKTISYKGITEVINKITKTPKIEEKKVLFTADFTIVNQQSDFSQTEEGVTFLSRIEELAKPKITVRDYSAPSASIGYKNHVWTGWEEKVGNKRTNKGIGKVKKINKKNISKQGIINFNGEYNKMELSHFGNRTLDNFDMNSFLNKTIFTGSIIPSLGNVFDINQKLTYLCTANTGVIDAILDEVNSPDFLTAFLEFVRDKRLTSFKSTTLGCLAIDIACLSLVHTVNDHCEKLNAHTDYEVMSLLDTIIDRVLLLISNDLMLLASIDDTRYNAITNFDLKESLEIVEFYLQEEIPVKKMDEEKKENSEGVISYEEIMTGQIHVD